MFVQIRNVAGTLFVVATPLGNLGDLSARAAAVLRQVGIVAAEDTRRTRVLLNHVGARPRVLSLHAHSDAGRLRSVTDALRDGHDVAYVTDAGTPVVSDPGADLVRSARVEGALVVPVPGPSAVATALSVSGLPADRYTFLGFLPRKGKERARLLAEAAASRWSVVLFEAANRLGSLLRDLGRVCGAERVAVVARELTKIHEEVQSGNLADLEVYYEEHPPRGEITLILSGRSRAAKHVDHESVVSRARHLLSQGSSRRDAAVKVAEEFSMPRNEAYRLVAGL